jgi:putative acetyltransferase
VEITIRPYDSADGLGPARVVQSVFEEYGFHFQLDGWDSDLADIATAYLQDGAFWVALDGAHVVGCIGVKPHGALVCELKRLYVLASHRGHRLGERLSLQAIDWARERGFRRVELWSDKKFPHAHALYECLGFVRFGERANDDPDQSHEWGYALDSQVGR